MRRVKTAAIAVISTFALTIPTFGPVMAQGTPNVAHANLLTQPFLLPETSLAIDIPMTWSELPADTFGPDLFESWLGSDTDDEDMIAAFGGSAPNQSGFGVMLISKAGAMSGSPLAEIQTIERGVKLSRLATWVFGSGMAIVRPSRAVLLEDGSGATVSFLSGPEDAHDLVTFTLVKRMEDNVLIVDIAPKGSDEAVILDQIRASLRPQ